MDNALSKSELKRLEELETGFASGVYESAVCMKEIRDTKLYRVYGTFEEYCLSRWNMSIRNVQRLIAFGDTVSNLLADDKTRPIGRLLTESATRPIASLPPETQVEIVRTASNNGQKVPKTKDIQAAKEKITAKPKPKPEVQSTTNSTQAESTIVENPPTKPAITGVHCKSCSCKRISEPKQTIDRSTERQGLAEFFSRN